MSRHGFDPFDRDDDTTQSLPISRREYAPLTDERQAVSQRALEIMNEDEDTRREQRIQNLVNGYRRFFSDFDLSTPGTVLRWSRPGDREDVTLWYAAVLSTNGKWYSTSREGGFAKGLDTQRFIAWLVGFNMDPERIHIWQSWQNEPVTVDAGLPAPGEG